MSELPNEQEGSDTAKLYWQSYHNGGQDRAGRTIKEVYAVDDNYVIYFSDHIYSKPTWGFLRRWLPGRAPRVGCGLFYETTVKLAEDLGAKDLGSADSALAGINRLLDYNQKEGSREYNFNFLILELAGDALKMVFCRETTEALEILSGLHDKLQAKEDGQRRLTYQGGAIIIAAPLWILYLWGYLACAWNPWMLAAALAMAGGLFSVFLNIKSLEVNVNQQKVFLLSAGATRSVIAFLAGIGMLLAMRSKMFAGITYEGSKPLLDGEPLRIAEMFFCFLAGFSESFVPNILSKSAAAKAADAKAAVEKTAAAKAIADKAAVDRAPAAPPKDEPHDKPPDKR